MFSGETDFRRVAVHAVREVKFDLTNVGRSPLNVIDVWVEDQDGAYRAVFDHEGPHNLIPGGSCAVNVRFRPKRVGTFPATFVIRTDSKQEPVVRVELAGTGVDARAGIPEDRLDFGRIELGYDKVRTLTLENPSELPVKVTPVAIGADRDEFSVEPFTLEPFASRTIDVRFTPTRAGRKQAALTVNPCEGCVAHIVTLIAEGLDRAIVAEPPLLDFGQVPMDRDSVRPVTLHNLSTEPQEVLSFALTSGTDPSFVHERGTAPVMLQGGEKREFEFRYTPGHMGAAQGSIVFGIGSKRNPELTVGMFGYGGAPELCISPADHKFSPKPVGSKVSVGVTVKNCGSSNSAPLNITEIVRQPSSTGVGGEDLFYTSDVGLPKMLAAGEEFTFRIFYEPTRVGEHAATFGIRTNGFQASVAQINIAGEAEDHLPCMLAITPGVVDFGTVPPRAEGVLGVKINNIGTDVCPVKNIEIVDDAGGVFKMPGGNIPGVIVHAGYWFSFMVEFDAPLTGGSFSGTLKVEVSDPANPVVYIPLVANTQGSCVVATPGWLDFGVNRAGCSLSPRKATLMNQCVAPVQINSVEIGKGTTDGEFVITDRPATPLTLNPGDTAEVEVEYLGTVHGMNLSPLYIAVDGLARPLLVSLVGETSSKGEITDRFVQQDVSKVDVLFVVDNTATMVEEHPKLVDAIPSFVSAAQAKQVDLHIAVTTTGIAPSSSACPGGANGGEAGRFFPVDNSATRIMTLNTANLVQELQNNVQVGQCAVIEEGFEAMRRALSAPLVNSADDPRTGMPNDGNAGFLRESAALAVIFVGDEDDHSPDAVEDYVSWLRALKGMSQPQRSVIYAIAPTAQSCSSAGGTGTRYAEAAAKTGGDVLSICASDYSPMLAQVANQAFSPQDTFALTSEPEPGSLRVYVDGKEVTSGWKYDALKNQVVFDSDPAPGAEIEVIYTKACTT